MRFFGVHNGFTGFGRGFKERVPRRLLEGFHRASQQKGLKVKRVL